MSTGKSSGTRSSASDLNTPENNTREQSSNGMTSAATGMSSAAEQQWEPGDAEEEGLT
jgi:hypothetical protein